MIIKIVCDKNLNIIFYVVKNILNLIMIIVPILLIIFGSISFIKLVKNPEEKNGTKKIINQFLAAAIVFFVPLFVNVVMGMLGENNSISRCWNDASKNGEATYISSVREKEKKKFIVDSEDYEPGVQEEVTSSGHYYSSDSQLDFSCKSNVVRSQFSCETLRIVEKHLYDFDATNYYKVINSYGGFENYAKSLGGIFAEYYGKKITGRTDTDYQIAAEYVLGWMYMFGWDGGYVDQRSPWGKVPCGGKHCPDAFYVNGGWKGGYENSYRPYNSWQEALAYHGPFTDFDDVISGKARGGISQLTMICGDADSFILNKLGLRPEFVEPRKVLLSDVRVGDEIIFRSDDRTSAHTVIVGEVYSDRIIVYDTGGSYTDTLNYKRTIMKPAVSSVEADNAAIRAAYGNWKFSENWGTRSGFNKERR